MPIGTSDGVVFKDEFEAALAPIREAVSKSIPQGNFESAVTALNLNDQEKALYQRHLKNLYGEGGVDNPDGSRSTLFQTSFEENGKTYNVPTVYDGKILKPTEAIDKAREIGLDTFPSYSSQDEAEKRYRAMHSFMDKDTSQYFHLKNSGFLNNEARNKFLPIINSEDYNPVGTVSPSEGDRRVQKMYSILGQALENRAKPFVEPVINYIKHVGDVLQGKADPEDVGPAADLAMSLTEGGLATANLKPGVGLFGGRMTKSAVATAERLESTGFSPLTIKEMTGLERGAEGMWRREFSDSDSHFYPQGFKDIRDEYGTFKMANLDEVLSHSELFKAYPEAADLAVYPVSKEEMNEYLNTPGVNTRGFFSPNYYAVFLDKDLPKDEAHSVLLHELQHWIQFKEGFNYGSPATVPKELADRYKGHILRKYYAERVNEALSPEDVELPSWLVSNPVSKKDLAELLLRSADYQLYKGLSTEVEARNVQARMKMTPRDIKRSLGRDTEDVERAEQIVQHGQSVKAGSSYNLGPPANDNGQLVSDIQHQYADMYREMNKPKLHTVPDVKTATPLEAVNHYYDLLSSGNKKAAHSFEEQYTAIHGYKAWSDGAVERFRESSNRPPTILEMDTVGIESVLHSYAQGKITPEQVRQVLKEKEWTLGKAGLRGKSGEVELFDPLGYQHFLNF